MYIAKKHYKNNFTHPDSGTILGILKNFEKTNKRIRIYYGFFATGISLPYIQNTVGTVNIYPVGYFLKNRRSANTDNESKIIIAHIVAIKDRYNWLYRHPSFSVGRWQILHNINKSLEVTNDVYYNGEILARCDTLRKAEQFVAFMKGKSMLKPNANSYVFMPAKSYRESYIPQYHVPTQ